MEQGRDSSKEQAVQHMFMCSKLYVAAFEGRTELVARLLTGSSGLAATAQAMNALHPGLCCSTREVTAERSTLLHIAAGRGHTDLIAEVIRRDSTLLSALNSSRDTPLHFAARAGHADAVRAIIQLARDSVEEAGPWGDVLRGKNEAGDTALHVACRHGRDAVVETLMKLVPELAAELNNAGVSPLYLAVMSRSVRAAAGIVGCRDDASAAGPMSQNALRAAILFHVDMVSLLMQWCPALATELDSNKSSPLHFASSNGDCSIIKEILMYAPPSIVCIQDSEGLSALHAAASMGNLPAIHICDSHGRNFLHTAAMKGHCSIISHVMKNRMLDYLLNEQDKEGNTALHLAVLAGEYRVISKLLSSGKMQVHIMNNDGHTLSDLIENSTGFYLMVRLVVKMFIYGVQFRPQRQDHINKWNGQDIMKWREATSKNLAIVSTLVATVAFSAAFNVPGSYGSDGKANLNGNRMYNTFLVLDTIAMTTSVMATILLVYGRASRSHRSWQGFIISMHFLWLSLISMMLAFFEAAAAVTSDKKAMKTVLYQLVYLGLYILINVLISLAMPGSITGRQRVLKKRINRQYPFSVIYALNMFMFIVVNTIAIAAMDITGNLR
ncbi:hypothetical protein PVAP13_8KG205600 [Panicum virgatum]|uniref:PGG domain-containing protein n=1 Tax=Panicum virgatum TaxID=38727 RepID=A0A8T0PSQ6_PANVG|nr:hypothetical protein PVAP13_8KG205600 [Panicum virgatum]